MSPSRDTPSTPALARAEEVPFARLAGIRRDASGSLVLPFAEALTNHLGTLHASAQMALAETAAGALLQETFADLAGRVLPVVREARGKFRSPATGTLSAHARLAEDAEAFLERLAAKGRASISVEVELCDPAGSVTLRAGFDWFVQRLD